jgi:hypothetical protein
MLHDTALEIYLILVLGLAAIATVSALGTIGWIVLGSHTHGTGSRRATAFVHPRTRGARTT